MILPGIILPEGSGKDFRMDNFEAWFWGSVGK
jgi:hypothetical protein